MKVILTIILLCIAFSCYSQPQADPRALFIGRKASAPENIVEKEFKTPKKDTVPELPILLRTFTVSPYIEDDGQLSGVIAVKVVVDCDGRIIKASSGERGTTIANVGLWKKCEQALLKSKLNSIEESRIDSGIVKFTFMLN